MRTVAGFLGLAVLVASLTTLLVACGQPQAPPLEVPDGAEAGDLLLEPCTLDKGGMRYRADCGTLVVPENRHDPEARLLALPVERLRAIGDNPTEPVFYLAGGPGNSNMRFAPPEAVLANHDVVLVGYRGIDGSTALECPEFGEALRHNPGGDLIGQASINNLTLSARECAARLQAEGTDLSGYTLLEIIGDLETVRQAFGYERIDLLGVSFGPRLIQIYSTLHPDVILRAAQITPSVPGHVLHEPADHDAVLRHVSDLCVEDATCSSRTDDLVATMRKALEEMPPRWLLFPLNRGKVLLGTWGLLYGKAGIATVVDAYIAAADGDYSGFWGLQLGSDMAWPNIWPWGAFFAFRFGATDGAVADYGSVVGSPDWTLMGAPNAVLAVAHGWPYQPLPAELRQVQRVEVETLFVTGSLDLAAPARQTIDELRQAYPNSQLVHLEEMGHDDAQGTLQPEAAGQLLASFFDTGVADASGYRFDPMNFTPPRRWFPPSPMPSRVKLLLGLGLGLTMVLVVLVILAVWLMVRRVRARLRAQRGG